MPLLTNRLLFGALLLFAVDLIWVLSSELSDHIYHEEHYDHPFFTVYFKTGIFMVFLLSKLGCGGNDSNGGISGGSGGYRLLTDVDEGPFEEEQGDLIRENDTRRRPPISTTIEDGSAVGGGGDEETDEEIHSYDPEEPAVLQQSVVVQQSPTLLSPPAYVPINYNTDDNTSDTDNNSGGGSNNGGNKVKFSRVAEVRHMSPKDALAATISRMSYHASLQAQEQALRSANRLSTIETARIALTFCGMWFLANYTYALSISTSSNQVALINVLSSTSSLFTLFLSAAFPSTPTSDRLTLSKLLLCLISLCGVTLISLEKTSAEGTGSAGIGAVWALVSAGFYAGYLVFLRRSVDGEQDKMDVFLFFGFVGLFNVLLLWPMFLVLHYSGLEPFVWPTHRQWLFLVVNGIVGTVFSEVLWVWSCLLTSSLIATLAITLTIPMSMIADVFFKHARYTWWFYIGSIPVVLAFVGVTALGSWGDWDPVGDCLKCPPVVVVNGRDNDHHHHQEDDTTNLLDDDEQVDETTNEQRQQQTSINS